MKLSEIVDRKFGGDRDLACQLLGVKEGRQRFDLMLDVDAIVAEGGVYVRVPEGALHGQCNGPKYVEFEGAVYMTGGTRVKMRGSAIDRMAWAQNACEGPAPTCGCDMTLRPMASERLAERLAESLQIAPESI